MNDFLGIKIIYSTNAVEKIVIERSWKERLFTLPWTPWKKTQIHLKPCIYMLYDSQLIIHPSLKTNLLEAMKGGEE